MGACHTPSPRELSLSFNLKIVSSNPPAASLLLALSAKSEKLLKSESLQYVRPGRSALPNANRRSGPHHQRQKHNPKQAFRGSNARTLRAAIAVQNEDELRSFLAELRSALHEQGKRLKRTAVLKLVKQNVRFS
jgi:hypothetical protein